MRKDQMSLSVILGSPGRNYKCTDRTEVLGEPYECTLPPTALRECLPRMRDYQDDHLPLGTPAKISHADGEEAVKRTPDAYIQ